MTGCLKNVLATIGCLTVLALAGGGAWVFRDQLAGLYRSLAHRPPPSAVAERAESGRPSAEALREAQSKQAAMGRRGGPGAVVLTPDQSASLIEAGLDRAARRAIDSLEIELGQDRLTLKGTLVTDVLGRNLMGPLAALLEGREPLVASGPLRLARPGRLLWAPDSFVVRSFPFPRNTVPRLIDRLTGGSDGGVWISVPPTVSDVRVRPDGMTFYRAP